MMLFTANNIHNLAVRPSKAQLLRSSPIQPWATLAFKVLKYTQQNAEFQRTARRDKKAFLSEQCKEIEEDNRMGKTRDLFQVIRDTIGTLHAKMGTIKDRNSRT